MDVANEGPLTKGSLMPLGLEFICNCWAGVGNGPRECSDISEAGGVGAGPNWKGPLGIR